MSSLSINRITIHKSNHANIKKQSGVATIIFVLLVGFALIATSAGIVYAMRGNIVKQVSVNAVTHAQTGVWTGAEAFRLFLCQLDGDEIETLSSNLDIEMDASYGSLSARNISVTDLTGGEYQISADIVNIHAAARSSATLNVVYAASVGSIPTAHNDGNSIDFDDDLNVAGGIEFYAPAGEVGLNVNGNVTLSGLNITPLDFINSIGKVSLDSDITVHHIHSNDDVSLKGTKVQTVKALGDFYADSAASVQQLWVNGNVDLNKVGGRFGFVDAIGYIEAEGSGSDGHGTFRSGDYVMVKDASRVELVEAVGDIDFSTWWGESVDAKSMKDIKCVSDGWSNATNLSANQSLVNCPPGSATTTATSNASNAIVPMQPLEPYVNSSRVVDVWELKSLANYIVEYDDDDSQIKITVNSVEGYDDGDELYIGDYSTTQRDYMCSQVDSGGNCLAPATPKAPICLHSSFNNSCIAYNTLSKKFTLNPNETAPGIMWFDGDLHLLGGQGMTSYLATGHITTRGAFKNSAANFAGYASVCEGDATHLEYDETIKDRYTDAYSAVYPSNLCDKTTFKYVSVLAGNFLTTKGDVHIKGLVLAANQGDKSVGDNSLGGKTIVDINRYGSETYDPTSVPNMGAANFGDSDGGPSVKILWSRYL